MKNHVTVRVQRKVSSYVLFKFFRKQWEVTIRVGNAKFGKTAFFWLYAFGFREKGSKKHILTTWIRITRKYTYHIMTRGSFHKNLNSIQDESFRGCSWVDDRWRGRRTQLLKSVTNILQCWNLAQSCFTLRRSKRHINHSTHSCWHQHFFTGNQQLLLYQEKWL